MGVGGRRRVCFQMCPSAVAKKVVSRRPWVGEGKGLQFEGRRESVKERGFRNSLISLARSIDEAHVGF